MISLLRCACLYFHTNGGRVRVSVDFSVLGAALVLCIRYRCWPRLCFVFATDVGRACVLQTAMIIDMLVQASSDLETHFVSVERVQEYAHVTPEVRDKT